MIEERSNKPQRSAFIARKSHRNEIYINRIYYVILVKGMKRISFLIAVVMLLVTLGGGS